jgi:hypothetical protein
MPFCGFKLVCVGQDPARWLQCPELRFGVEVEEATGEVLRVARRAEWRGLIFTVTASVTGFSCVVSGSFHKYRNGGTGNADTFTYADFRGVVADLCQRFGIDPATARLVTLEIGANVPLAYSPVRVLKAAVSFGKTPFSLLDPGTPSLGLAAERTKQVFKLYDKARQSGRVGANLLRVEVRAYYAQQIERYGLRTLADLTDEARVSALVGVLLGAIDEVIFIDPKADVSALTPGQRLALETYRIPSTWQEMTFTDRQGQRQRLGRILEKCKHFDYQTDLRHGVQTTWESLFLRLGKAEKMATFSNGFPGGEAVENSYVFQTWITLKNIAIGPLGTVPGTGGSSDGPTEPRAPGGGVTESQPPGPAFLAEKCKHSAEGRSPDAGKKGEPPDFIFLPETAKNRTCQTCGASIGHQRPQSRFCSERYTGKRAKQCRNKASNHRRTLKNQVMRATHRNQFLRVVYFDPDGAEEYAEILHASEIAVTGEWLDRVRRVEVVPGPDAQPVSGCTATGQPARTWLTELTTQNQPNP